MDAITHFLIDYGYWGMFISAFLAGSVLPSIDRAYQFMGSHGAWMGFFAFLPILGSAITVVLGLTRANLPLSVFSITLGKVMRYSLLIWGANLFM